MQSQNEEDREEHRSQNRDRVRSYRQRKQHGITNIIAQNEPISLIGANNPFNGHMVLDHEQLHTMSNVPISHEYEKMGKCAGVSKRKDEEERLKSLCL